MVKAQSNLCERKEPVPEGGNPSSFPLMGGLQTGKLRLHPPDKVIVTSSTSGQAQWKSSSLSKGPSCSLSDRVKFTGLFVAIVLLALLLLVVMYTALWMDQRTCPKGFVLKSKHCTAEARLILSGQRGALSALAQQGSLYSTLANMGQKKRAMPELLPSSWLPIISALKEARLANEEPSHTY